MKRALILAPVFALLAAFPALAEKIPLGEISSYFNKMTTAETEFQQVNSDGSTSSGRLILQRPGRMRFEYAPPDRTLVLASAGQVAVFDGKSNQPPEQYPLAKTPLNLILARNVDLSRAEMVVGHDEVDGYTVVTAQDPENPDLGTIEMAFSANPLALTQWTVTDQAGGRTTVLLGPLKTGQSYPIATFSINAEADKLKRRVNR